MLIKVANIDDFLKSGEENDKEIDKSYESGFHLEWITYIDSMLEQFLKTFLFAYLVGERIKLNRDKEDYIKNASMETLLNICYLKKIISEKLYDDIKSFRKRRNLIVHHFIIKNEKLEGIDLLKFKEFGKGCKQLLVEEFLAAIGKQMIAKRAFDEVLNEMNKVKKTRG
jgi:hypothetical protein